MTVNCKVSAEFSAPLQVEHMPLVARIVQEHLDEIVIRSLTGEFTAPPIIDLTLAEEEESPRPEA